MTQKQLEDLFWRATVMCLGLDPDSEDEAVHKRVRISWPTSETGNSNWGRDEDVVFLRVSPGIDAFATAHDSRHIADPVTGEVREIVTYQRSIRVIWVCYGPNSDEDADRIRIGLFREAVRGFLIVNGVAVQPHIREPVRVTEPDEAGQWWERCDLTADAYEGITREYPADFIDRIDEIRIEF